MARRTVTNGGKTVSTKATGDVAQVLKPDDECWVDAAKKFLPFDNKIGTEKLVNGTTSVTIAGASVWILPAQLGPKSGPPHAGVRGRKSKKPAHGEAVATKGSETLTAQGKPVIRLDDPTEQNSGNTVGKVKAAAEDWGTTTQADGSGQAAADGGGKGKGKTPKKANEKMRRPGFPPSGTEPVDQCQVTGLYGCCDHNRPLKDFTIEVCGSPEKEIVWAFAGVNGICPHQPHPDFFVNGVKQPPRSNPLECAFQIPTPLPDPPYELKAWNLIADWKMEQYPHAPFKIEAKGCIPGSDAITIKAFKGTVLLKRRYDVNDFPLLAFLKTYLDAIAGAVSIVCDGTEPICLLTGGLDLEAQVKEHDTSHRVFIAFKVVASMDPLIQVNKTIPLAARAMAKALVRVYQKLGKVGEALRAIMRRASKAPGSKSEKESWGPISMATSGLRMVGTAIKNAGEELSKWGQQKLESGKAGEWEKWFATAGIYAGELMKDLNPLAVVEELKEGIMGAGPYLTINGAYSVFAEVARPTPDSNPFLNQKRGFSGKLSLTIGLKADLMKGRVFSFDFNGTAAVTASGAAFADDRGLGISDASLACKSLSVTSRIKLLGAFESLGVGYDSAKSTMVDDALDQITGAMDRPNIEAPDTFDFIQQFPDFGAKLNYKQAGKKYLYQYKP